MIILIVLAYICVGVFELLLWPKRPLKETLTYLVLLAAMATLSVLLILNIDLTLPSPGALLNLFTSLWGGGK